MDQHAAQMGQSSTPGPSRPQFQHQPQPQPQPQPQHHPEFAPYPQFQPHLQYQPHLQHQPYPQFQPHLQYQPHLQHQPYPQYQPYPQFQPQRLGPYPPELYPVGHQPVAPGPAGTYRMVNMVSGPGVPPTMQQMMGPPDVPLPSEAIPQRQTVAGESLVKQGKRKADDLDDTQGDSIDNPILIPPPYHYSQRGLHMGVPAAPHPPVDAPPAPPVAVNPPLGVPHPHPHMQVPPSGPFTVQHQMQGLGYGANVQQGFLQPAPVGAAQESSVRRGKRKAEEADDARGDTKQPRYSSDDIPGFERVEYQGGFKYKCLQPTCKSLLMRSSVRGHVTRCHPSNASRAPSASAPARWGKSTFPDQPVPPGLFALQERCLAQQAPTLPMIGQSLPTAPAAPPAIQATRPESSSMSQRIPPLPVFAQGTISLAGKLSVQAPPEPRPSGIPPMPIIAQDISTIAVGGSDEGLFGSGDEDSSEEDSDDNSLFGSSDDDLYG